MENGAQPAGGGHWLAAAPPNIRDRVVEKIMSISPQVKDLHGIASRYEAMVFSQSNSLQDYLRTISMKVMGLQKWQPVGPAASDHQQQAHMGQQMRPLNAVPANSSAASLPRTASGIPLTVRPPHEQNMHIKVNQAQPSFATPVASPQFHHVPRNITSTTQVAPVVQLDPRYPTVVTQVQTQCLARHNSTQQAPQLTRMNPQQDLRHIYNTHGGAQSNVATMQIGYHEGQNRKQFGHPQVQKNQQSAAEVDWREEMFQKITSLKDAHLSELMEFEREIRARVPQCKTNEQVKSLPKEQAGQYKVENIMARISGALRFLQLQKSNIPERAKDQFDNCQASLYSLLQIYRESKACNARKNAGLQSANCHELPGAVNITGATDNIQQTNEEQPAAEALAESSQNFPAEGPLAQQQNHSHHLAGDQAENGAVHRVAEASVASNLTPVTGDTAPFAGGTCYGQIQQEHAADEATSQLTHIVDPAGTSPAQQHTHSAHSAGVEAEDDSEKADAETPIAVQAAKTSLSPTALPVLASDTGANLKRAFPHMTSGTMDKRRKTHYGSLPDEISATCRMLVETDITISEDNTGGAGGTVIKLWYNPVSLAPDFRAAIGASEISTKLFVPADYPQSSPVIYLDGGQSSGLPGVVDMAFRRNLALLPEPRSIEEMTRAWDSVGRTAVAHFAHRVGGGMFCTRYGHW